MNTSAKYDKDIHDSLPDVLKQICLNCDRPRCVGKCKLYEDASRAYYRERGMTNRSGAKPKLREFRGEMLTLNVIAERMGICQSTIRKRLRTGLTLEQIDAGIRRRGAQIFNLTVRGFPALPENLKTLWVFNLEPNGGSDNEQ